MDGRAEEKEGESEAGQKEVRQERKEEARQDEGGKEGSEAGRGKPERVGPSNQRHSSASLTSKRQKSGRRYEGHLHGHRMYEYILNLRPDRYSGSADCREGTLQEAGAEHHNITEAAPNELKLGEGA